MKYPLGPIAVCSVLVLTAVGSLHAAGASEPLSVFPSNGAASMQAFTVVVSNPGSAAIVNLRHTTHCHAEYNVLTNQFRLLGDNLSTWSNPFAPGSGGLAANSQCELSATGASAVQSGLNLLVTFPLIFKPEFRGVHNIEGAVLDTFGGLNDWRYLGMFTALGPPPPPTPIAPFVGSGFDPIATSGLPPTRAYRIGATSLHRGGPQYSYLTYVLLLPLPNTASFTAAGTCLVEYNKLSNGVRLVDDAGTGWLGPLEGVPITPAAPVLQNSVCSVDVSKTEVNFTGAPNAPNVWFWITPKPALSGLIGIYQQVQDVDGKWTDFRQGDAITFFDAPQRPGPNVVPVVQIEPNPPTGAGTARAVVRHSGGVNQIGQVHVRFSRQIVPASYDPSISPPPVCHIVYIRANDTIGLVNDAGTGLTPSGAIPRGTTTTLSNQRCSLNVGSMAATISGDTLTLDLPVTFQQINPFNDQPKVWVNAFDISGTFLSHWVQSGVWNVSPACAGTGCP